MYATSTYFLIKEWIHAFSFNIKGLATTGLRAIRSYSSQLSDFLTITTTQTFAIFAFLVFANNRSTFGDLQIATHLLFTPHNFPALNPADTEDDTIYTYIHNTDNGPTCQAPERI